MPRALSQEQACALLNDIDSRYRLNRYINARTSEALADKFGVSRQTIYLCERRRPPRMDQETYLQINVARYEYRESKKRQLRLYDIGKKYGVSVKCVCRYQQIYHDKLKPMV